MSLRINSIDRSPAFVVDPAKSLRLNAFDNDSFAATITPVAGVKIARAGSFVSTDNKLLKRALLLTSVAAAATEIWVNNPWAFTVGDALRVIAAPRTAAATELAAIVGATGASLGTITAIELGIMNQTSRITLTSAIVGNILAVNLMGISISYRIATTVIADEIVGLCKAITTALASCDERLRYIQANPLATYAEIKSTKPYEIIEFEALLSQGSAGSLGAIATSTDQGLGKITLSAPVPAALVQGTKIGTVTQIPAGFLDSESDLTYYQRGILPNFGIAPMYGGQLYTNGLPYMDGQIADRLRQMAWMPQYL
jgi:hypothetical protein